MVKQEYTTNSQETLQVEDSIAKLERRIADILELCENMSRENEVLKMDQQMMRNEFAALQKKNKIARDRMEHIIARLKSIQP